MQSGQDVLLTELLDEIISAGIGISVTESQDLNVRIPEGQEIAADLVVKLKGNKRRLVEYLNEQRVAKLDRVPVFQLEEQDYYSLSDAQTRMWVLNSFPGAAEAYIISDVFLFPPLNKSALEWAVRQMVRKHEILRTLFLTVEGLPKQKVIPFETFELPLSFCSVGGAGEQVRKLVEMEMTLPFDLEKGPLVRIKVLELADGNNAVIICLHHIVGDAWSMDILYQELRRYYGLFASGADISGEILPVQYKEFVSWQNRYLRQMDSKKSRSFWLSQFSDRIPDLDFPTDNPRPEIKSYQGITRSFPLSEKITASLGALSREYQSTPFVAVLSAVTLLLNKYTGQTDIVIGSPVTMRERSEFQNQIGFFLNTLPLRVRFDGADTLAKFLIHVKDVVMTAFTFQNYPFDKLVGELGLTTDMSKSPLFDVLVVYRTDVMVENRTTPVAPPSSGSIDVAGRTSKFDLTFTFIKTDKNMEVSIEYRSDIFCEDRIQMVSYYLERILDAMASCQASSLDQICRLISLGPPGCAPADIPFKFETVSQTDSTGNNEVI